MTSEIDKILIISIELLESLDVYKEIQILYDYSIINVVDGVKLDKDINTYIENTVIKELEKQYLSGKTIELNDTQNTIIKSFEETLDSLDKPNLYKLNPDNLFNNVEEEIEDNILDMWDNEIKNEDYEKDSFRTLRIRLQILLDFFMEMNDQGYKSFRKLCYSLQDKIDIMEEVYKDTYTPFFTAKLNLALKENKLSQNKLSKMMGIRQPTVNAWFNGTLPSLPRTVELAKHLNVSLDYLLRPNSDKGFLTTGYISDETGLTTETIQKMKEIKNRYSYKNNIIKIVELLILNFDKPNTDLLTEIANYLKPTHSKKLYLISDEELNNLADSIIEDSNDIREVKSKLNDFTHYIEKEVMYKTDTIYDVSNIQLQNITKILIRIKDRLLDEQ